MTPIKQGILVAIIVFIGTMIIGHFIFGRINWLLSFGIATGSLLGILLKYYQLKSAQKQKESGD
jgi:xanthine/uracil permease